jgi:ATP-dependent RNA helicase DeaD
MAHLATIGDGDEKEIAAQAPPADDRGARGAGPRPRPGRPAEEGMARLFIGAGRGGGIRPADLVGAIAGEAKVPSSVIGNIRIAENFSVVEVPEDLADQIIASMRGASLRGKKALVRRDRDAPS